MLDVPEYILTDVKAVLTVPASVIFTEDQLDELAHNPNITWGDMDRSLIKPSRLIGPDWPDELNDIFRLLDAAKVYNYATVYIDLEN